MGRLGITGNTYDITLTQASTIKQANTITPAKIITQANTITQGLAYNTS